VPRAEWHTGYSSGIHDKFKNERMRERRLDGTLVIVVVFTINLRMKERRLDVTRPGSASILSFLDLM